MSSLSLKHVSKTYSGGITALDDFSLDVEAGELVVLTGAAGSGKTAVLRILCGLDEPTSGEVYIGGSLALGMSTRERDIALVTNEHPVFSKKMTVFDALGYGLKIRNTDAGEIASRVNESASLMGIEHLLESKVSALSEGDTRRVALCRALVRRPQAVLLDDILCGLEGLERIRLITEIIRLNKMLGVPFVCTTPDGADAMTLGSRVAVMKEGRLRQYDTPQWLYDNPADAYVATFLGAPAMNMLKGRIVRKEGKLFVRMGKHELPITRNRAKRILDVPDEGIDVLVGLRAEDIHSEQMFIEASPDTVIEPEVRLIERLGGECILYMSIDGRKDYIVARVDARTHTAAGEKIRLVVDGNRIRYFDLKSGRNLSALPELNMIPCRLLPKDDGTLSLAMGDAEMPIPQSVTARLIDRSVIGGDIFLAVPPDGLSFEPFAGSIGLKGEIEFTVEHPSYSAVYINLAVCGKTVVALAPHESDLSAGEKVTVHVSPEKQTLCRISGARLIAALPVTDNTATASIAVKGDTAVLSFGKNKFKVPAVGFDAGVGKVRIPPKSVGIGKGENTLSGLVIDRDFTGEFTLLYVKTEGFEPYFTAAIEGAAAVSVGDKVKLSIDAAKITTASVTPLSEYIRDAAAAAPATVTVTPEDV